MQVYSVVITMQCYNNILAAIYVNVFALRFSLSANWPSRLHYRHRHPHHNYHLPPVHECTRTLLVRLVPNQYFTMCVGNRHIRSPGTHNMYISRAPDSIYRCYLITSSLCVSRERTINKCA